MFASPAQPVFRRTLMICGIATLVTASTTFADPISSHPLRRHVVVYRSRPAGFALQPFSMPPAFPSASRSLHVAYYTPHTAREAEPISRDEEREDTSDLTSTGGSHPTVSGNRAVLRHGVAYAPSNAPDRVKNAIWAVNGIRTRPYVWGGGHGSFTDRGYDCSGTVSFALHHAGALSQPLPSSDLLRFGERGNGRWITVYSRHGHTFATIAGLRLDTTDFRYGGDVGPRWYNEGRSTWGFEARHPVGL